MPRRRTIPLSIASLLLFVSSARAQDATGVAFERWVASHAPQTRQTYGHLELDGLPGPESMAVVSGARPAGWPEAAAWWVYGARDGRVWVVPDDCPAEHAASVDWGENAQSQLRMHGFGYSSGRTFALRDGRLVIRGSSVGGPYYAGSVNTDWDARLRRVQPGSDGGDDDDTLEAFVIAPRPRSKARTWVTWGAKNVAHAHDAGLDVVPSFGVEQVELRISWTDDVRVPFTGDFLAADHLELWMSPAPDVAIQLGVAERPDGTLEMRWLHGEAPLPTARRESDGSVVLTLGPEQLGSKGWSNASSWSYAEDDSRCSFHEDPLSEWPLTVVFSDNDDPQGGQQSLVATSQLQWGRRASFGALIRFHGQGRYPEPPGVVAFTAR